MTPIATLPMYNVTPALAGDWRALLTDVLAAVDPATRIVEPDDDLLALWRAPNLLLSQTCGYPFTHALADTGVQLVATPVFDVEGCDGANYSSAIVVRADAACASVEDTRGWHAAYNSDDSHSGMNALRHAVAPYAQGGRFFGAVLRTGSHAGSLQAIAEGRADVAAIDCVTMAYVRAGRPELAKAVRPLGYTRQVPGLPLIAARGVSGSTIAALRVALNKAVTRDTARAERLRLRSFVALSSEDYTAITRMEDEARAAGYPQLA